MSIDSTSQHNKKLGEGINKLEYYLNRDKNLKRPNLQQIEATLEQFKKKPDQKSDQKKDIKPPPSGLHHFLLSHHPALKNTPPDVVKEHSASVTQDAEKEINKLREFYLSKVTS